MRRTRPKHGSDALTELSSLSVGDLVVHADHGIGRFVGLTTIEAAGEPHDCLEIHYQGGDKLYLPVENIELLTRFGSEEAGVQLDRLGGVAWQSRKAKLKQRIRDIAEKLIKVAALRQLRQAPVITPPDGLYDEFSARFPYEETEDQTTSINAVLDDLASGRPMDPVDLRRSSASARPRWRCAQACSRCLPASRSPSWCRPRFSRASTSTLSPSASAGCR